MPVLAGAAHADRTAILGHVGDHDDLRATLHTLSFTEDVELDFTKTTGKGHLLRGRDMLIAEEDDGVLIVGALDSGERLIVDGSSQVDTAELGAGRNNLDRHGLPRPPRRHPEFFNAGLARSADRAVDELFLRGPGSAHVLQVE